MDKEQAVARIEELEKENKKYFDEREKIIISSSEIENQILENNKKIDEFSELINKNKEKIVKYKNYLEILQV